MRGIWRDATNFSVNPAETIHSRSPSPVAGSDAQASPLHYASQETPLPESEESYGEEEAEAIMYVGEPPEAAGQVERE